MAAAQLTRPTPLVGDTASSSAAGGCVCSLKPPSLATNRSVRCPPAGAANAAPASAPPAAPLHLSQISSRSAQRNGAMSLTIVSPDSLALSDRPRSAVSRAHTTSCQRAHSAIAELPASRRSPYSFTAQWPLSQVGQTLGQAVCNRVAYQGVPGAYSEQVLP